MDVEAGMGDTCFGIFTTKLNQSSIWLCDKYLINSWNISLAFFQSNTGLLLHICRSDYSDGSDSGDKRNGPHHSLWD